MAIEACSKCTCVTGIFHSPRVSKKPVALVKNNNEDTVWFPRERESGCYLVVSAEDNTVALPESPSPSMKGLPPKGEGGVWR